MVGDGEFRRPRSRRASATRLGMVLRAWHMDSIPRLLLFDFTRIGDHAATGQLKATLFAEWPRDRLMQVSGGWRPRVDYTVSDETGELALTDTDGMAHLTGRIEAFAPEAILYRPVPNTPWLHQLAMETIRRLQVPLITWIVDDWPASLRLADLRAYVSLDRDLRSLFRQSAGALAIGEAMSKALAARYGRPFAAFANGVQEADWPVIARDPAGPVRVRYSGGIAENMGLASLIAVAASIERLAAKGANLILEIGARQSQIDRFKDRFAAFTRTSFHVTDLPPEDYRRWISSADILLITYNFDEASKAYIRYSVANKLPECLASGAPILGVGPRDVATMALLADLDCSVNVFDETPEALDGALSALIASPQRRHDLAARSRDVAFGRFDVRRIRLEFMAWLSGIAASGRNDPVLRAARRTESSLWGVGEMLHPGPSLAPIGSEDPALSEGDRIERRQDLLAKLGALAGRLRDGS